MNTTKLALIGIFAVTLFATMGFSTAQAAKHHHRHHLIACPAKPGTFRALFCPAAPAQKK